MIVYNSSLMDETQTLSEIASEITGKKASVLRSLRFFEGSANARQIRRVGDIPAGSMHHHTSSLIDRGLIHHIGEEHVGKGGEAKLYELTATGEEVAEEVAEREVSLEEMDRLMDEVEEYEHRMDRLQSSHEETEAEIERLREQFDQIQETLGKVLNYFEEEGEESF